MTPTWVALVAALVAFALGAAAWRFGGRPRAWLASLAAIAALAAALSTWLAATHLPFASLPGLVRFGQPLRLALPVVVAVACLWRARTLPRTLGPTRRVAMWAFGSLAAVAASIAFASPEWGHRIDRLTVVLAVDRSRSIDLVEGGDARVRDEEARAIQSMRDEDRIARVVFGAEAVTEDPAHPRRALPSAQQVPLGRDATDLGAAIRRALAEVPDESAGRVVLLSDGASNRGDPLGAAAAASAAGVPVDVVRLRATPRRDLRVEALRAPVTASEGEAFELRVVTRSTVPADVDVRVQVDGRTTASGTAHVGAGEDVVTLAQTAPSAGLHRYEVDVTARDPALDAIVQDNRGGTFLRVRGPASALILEGDAGHETALATAFRAANFHTDERGPEGFPDDLAQLAAYDLVVLSDVPARLLAPEQLDQLATYVRDLGGGLLLMGGDRSMGPGGYSRTPVEEISPVSFDMRQERRRASLSQVIAIDFSGSMSLTVPTGQTKLQLANEAAARSAMLLGATDRLGVMHVDTEVHWTVPLATIGGDLGSIVSRIRAVGPSGGGIIIPVTLEQSYRALAAQPTNLRHLLLFSDGGDSEEIQGQAPVVAQAFARGITTSVVSMGRGSDTPELEHLSREGHGRFYLVEDATRLPAVFAQETMLAARSSIREENFHPTPRAPDEVTRGIDFAAGPALRGWVVTIPRPRAQVLLSGPDNDPILSRWQVGVGRVAAFASDARDRWGVDWQSWPEAQRMWAELARSLARRPDPLVRVEADTAGGTLHVHADARTVDGYADSLRRLTATISGPGVAASELALDPDGAGTYGADLALDRPGAYAIAVRDEATGVVVASAGAILLEGEELRPPADPQLLDRIASMTGGRVRATLAGLFDDRLGLRRAYTPLAPALLEAAVVLMLLALASRRLGVPEALTDALDRRRARASAREATEREPAAAAQHTIGALLERRRDAAERAPVAHAPVAPIVSPPPREPAAVSAPEPPAPPPASADGGATGSRNLDALLARKRARR